MLSICRIFSEIQCRHLRQRCRVKLQSLGHNGSLRVSLLVLVLMASSIATAAEPSSTLESGIFGDEQLILAADPDTGKLSGYYHDGDCRVFLSGKLAPVIQYQRAGLGESYEVESWDPQRPSAKFTTTLYSRARGGFAEQVTLEPGPDDGNRPAACSWRISLDRAGHVGNSLIGAAVIARPRPRLFELKQVGEAMGLVPKGRAALRRDTGVWVTKTYGAAWSLPGMVLISWYDPPGTPHGGYVRTRDLYALPPAAETESASLSCMMLKDGTFEALGDCARRDPDGSSYTIDTAALRLLDFDRWGLATLVIREEGYAYVRRDGRALVVPTFDNAPDEFINGLVRVKIGEKFGYADRGLKVVIPAIYDGSYRFSKGRARACLGCVSVSDGEHCWYRGGQPVCLDRRGGQRDSAECGSTDWLPSELREYPEAAETRNPKPTSDALHFGQMAFARSDIARVMQSFDQRGFAVLDIALQPDATKRLEAETLRLLNKDVSILIGSTELSSARLVEPITEGRLRLSGRFSLREAQDMAGQIICTMHLSAEQYDSPSLANNLSCKPKKEQGIKP